MKDSRIFQIIFDWIFLNIYIMNWNFPEYIGKDRLLLKFNHGGENIQFIRTAFLSLMILIRLYYRLYVLSNIVDVCQKHLPSFFVEIAVFTKWRKKILVNCLLSKDNVYKIYWISKSIVSVTVNAKAFGTNKNTIESKSDYVKVSLYITGLQRTSFELIYNWSIENQRLSG